MLPIRAFMSSGRSVPSVPNTDDFSTNTIANYSQAGIWSISGGFLNHTTDIAPSVLMRNGVSWVDGTVSAVVTEAGNAGVFARMQDTSNYYVAIVRDASSTSGAPNTIELYVRTGGFTSLGSSTISFTRDTPHTLELVMSGTSLIVKFDGVTKISTTNSTFTTTGLVGLWGNTLPNQFDSFSW